MLNNIIMIFLRVSIYNAYTYECRPMLGFLPQFVNFSIYRLYLFYLVNFILFSYKCVNVHCSVMFLFTVIMF